AAPGALRLRRLRPAAAAGRPDLAKAGDRAVPVDAVRAAALLPVRARGGLAGARLRERVLRSLADDPARVPAGRDGAPGARAGAGVEAALRERRRPHPRALPAGRALVADGPRRGAGRRVPGGRRGACREHDPARERARRVPARVGKPLQSRRNSPTRELRLGPHTVRIAVVNGVPHPRVRLYRFGARVLAAGVLVASVAAVVAVIKNVPLHHSSSPPPTTAVKPNPWGVSQ